MTEPNVKPSQPVGYSPPNSVASAASNAAPSHPLRRGLILGAAGAVAAAAGVGAAWWQRSSKPVQDPALQAFWALNLATPQGGMQPMQSYAGRPLLVNFWATWCPPCVRELPLLSAFAKEAAAQLQVLGLAVDQAGNVQRWLQRQPLDFPVLMAGAGGIGLTRSLGNEAGGLPFSVLLDSAGGVLARKIGELSDADLQQWLLQVRA